MSGNRIGVLIVDDSAVVRQALSARLSNSGDIEVIGVAADPIFAMERMNRVWPDVVVLDIEMPRMDGITFLKKIMSTRPTPVVICSTMTTRGAETTMDALAAGAVSVIPKPTTGLKQFIQDEGGDIVSAVRAAARSNVRRAQDAVRAPVSVGPAPSFVSVAERGSILGTTTDRVVAIGTSTGGTQALEVVLTALPPTCAGIVIVQHMPEKFTAAFAARLDGLCELEVSEAVDGDRVLTGRALVAPGGKHMELRRDGAQYRVRVFDGPLVNRHRPSVDVLFRSVAKMAGRNALGVIMTGMGDDGARGLLEMRRAGAFTVAQDEATSLVYGMPHEAVQLGAAEREAPLSAIPEVIRKYG
ncbi:protein-glutamate methylesterase/protein-glutamine glutaminase [Cryptosporangium aurantiacum]|uniref:Protein-glutamate methylesterase/protein-glutamine glutaminase n=1 Tax=Cryptosporangium aurantiacum TaxID=134849 RepID=A0A1M7RGM4_9ACTN|nr:chemotaxis response regulator protein-glutamate methylesterase [Cryptosporangium aurantiacum]SHN45366.1 two-component system, chemotaxis family, response regulator CheB [Cryptosporangium aurantiacum]